MSLFGENCLCKCKFGGVIVKLFGKIAIGAMKLIEEDMNPYDAWWEAAKKETKSKHSQGKGCPRNAFLGLCEEGYIKGIEKGNYTSSIKNKGYAVDAFKIVSNNENEWKAMDLWREVIIKPIDHSGQMHVVLALKEANLLNT
jgi:hypothetical protein